MRLSLLATVAAGALAFASITAQATSPSAPGASQAPAPAASGAASGSGGATAPRTGTAGSGSGTAGSAGGTAGSASGTATTGGGATTSGGAATTGGAATSGGGATVNLTTEQRTQAVTTLRSVNIEPVTENVTLTVGQTVPTSVTRLVDCPQTLMSLITGVRDCKVVLVGNTYYIVEGSSRRVVTTISR